MIQDKSIFHSPLDLKDTNDINLDMIGDVHGCIDELLALLQALSYQVQRLDEDRDIPPYFGYKVQAPKGRRLIFVGDLTDRGNDSPEVLRLVMSMNIQQIAYSVRGNHDDKLMRKLAGRDVKMTGGLDITMEQLKDAKPSFLQHCHDFLDTLPSHVVLLDGSLVIAHAGLKEEYHGIYTKKTFANALYGPTRGKQKDEYGLPIRIDWAKDYTGKAIVIYGHTPQLLASWRNNTINIDTGCVFGGMLTALRYPEKELITIKALDTYAEAKRPLQ